MIEDVDVAVIGAGAAGIAAGRTLSESRLSFVLVEAEKRIGGRARTVTHQGLPLDLGCGWLHSADRNPWATLADRQGAPIDKTPPAWGTQFADLGFGREDQAPAGAAFEQLGQRLREMPPASDCAVDALDPDGKWNSYLDALSGYMNGAGLADLSVRDFLAYDEADTGVNWRLPDGLGAFIAGAARDLSVVVDCPVALVDRRTAPLVLETKKGRLCARAAIVTVPTPLLAAEALRFEPPLPDKVDAAASLPLGFANKLFLHVDQPEEFEPDKHMLGSPHRVETGSYYLRPFGRPLIEVFFGGAGARLLEHEGKGAMAAFAIDELVGLFGSGLRRRVHPMDASEWGSCTWIRGAYSHARPGRSEARATLAKSVEDRLFFAGEAVSPHDFSTAHGAYASGEKAARDAIAALADDRR